MYIDIFLAIFLIIGIIQGYSRGIIRTIFALLGVLVGFLLTLKLSPYVVTFFENTLHASPMIALILGLVLTFLVLLFGIKWIGNRLENTLKLARINILNKITGAVLFAIVMIVIYSLIIWFLSRSNVLTEKARTESRSYPFLLQVPARAGTAFEKIKPVFHEFWEKMDQVIAPDDQEGASKERPPQ